MKKKPIQRPIRPIKQTRNLGEHVIYKTKDDKTFYDMHYGRIPMPELNIPEKIRKDINKKCTVEHKDYITKKVSLIMPNFILKCKYINYGFSKFCFNELVSCTSNVARKTS